MASQHEAGVRLGDPGSACIPARPAVVGWHWLPVLQSWLQKMQRTCYRNCRPGGWCSLQWDACSPRYRTKWAPLSKDKEHALVSASTAFSVTAWLRKGRPRKEHTSNPAARRRQDSHRPSGARSCSGLAAQLAAPKGLRPLLGGPGGAPILSSRCQDVAVRAGARHVGRGLGMGRSGRDLLASAQVANGGPALASLFHHHHTTTAPRRHLRQHRGASLTLLSQYANTLQGGVSVHSRQQSSRLGCVVLRWPAATLTPEPSGTNPGNITQPAPGSALSLPAIRMLPAATGTVTTSSPWPAPVCGDRYAMADGWLEHASSCRCSSYHFWWQQEGLAEGRLHSAAGGSVLRLPVGETGRSCAGLGALGLGASHQQH